MTAAPETEQIVDVYERRLPPVAELAVFSMALVIVSGIYLAAHLPHRPPLAPAEGLLAAAGVLLVADAVVVSRLSPFNWEVFFRVGGWALLAYGVIAGMLEFIFVFDHTRGASLVVFTLSLVVFAIDVPLLLAFSVARYQEVGPPPRR
jgi:hypothetical protein